MQINIYNIQSLLFFLLKNDFKVTLLIKLLNVIQNIIFDTRKRIILYKKIN